MAVWGTKIPIARAIGQAVGRYAQAWSKRLHEIAQLPPGDGMTIVGDGTSWGVASGPTLIGWSASVKASDTTLADASYATMGVSVTLAADTTYLIGVVSRYVSPSADAIKLKLVSTSTATAAGTVPRSGNSWANDANIAITTSGSDQGALLIGTAAGGASGGTLTLHAAKQADTGADGTFYATGTVIWILEVP